MSVSTKTIQKQAISRLNQAGISVVELLVVIGISSALLIAFFTVSIFMYGDTIRSSIYAQLAGESQLILRSVVEELRQSSSIRETNLIPDPNAPNGSWTTSNSNLILIISTPALDSSNNFIVNPDTGYPYENEIVYFTSSGRLYKRFIANSSATGNSRKTTCPQAIATTNCPADVLMSSNFKDLNFVFYDQDDAVTTTIANSRSIRLLIQMERSIYGKTLTFDNTIRITMRNLST